MAHTSTLPTPTISPQGLPASETFLRNSERALEYLREVQLASQRNLYQAEQELASKIQEGKSYTHPSYFKYGILFVLAGIVDFLDVLTDFFGLGTLITPVIGRVISAIVSGMIIFIFWVTDTRRVDAQAYAENIQKTLKNLQARVIQAKKALENTAQFVSKITRNESLATSVTQGIRKLEASAGKLAQRTIEFLRTTPLASFLPEAGANVVPVLAAAPWLVLGVIFSYRAEASVYKAAREAAQLAEQELRQTT